MTLMNQMKQTVTGQGQMNESLISADLYWLPKAVFGIPHMP